MLACKSRARAPVRQFHETTPRTLFLGSFGRVPEARGTPSGLCTRHQISTSPDGAVRLRNGSSCLKIALAQVSAPKRGFSGVKVLTLTGSTGEDLRRAGGQIRCCIRYTRQCVSTLEVLAAAQIPTLAYGTILRTYGVYGVYIYGICIPYTVYVYGILVRNPYGIW